MTSPRYDFASSIKIPLFQKQEGNHLKSEGANKISNGYINIFYSMAEFGTAATLYSHPVGAAIMTFAAVLMLIHSQHQIKTGREQVREGERLLIEADETLEKSKQVAIPIIPENTLSSSKVVLFPAPTMTPTASAVTATSEKKAEIINMPAKSPQEALTAPTTATAKP